MTLIEGSIAYECGFRSGDVVTTVSSTKVTHPLEILNLLHQLKKFGKANIEIIRDDLVITQTLDL